MKKQATIFDYARMCIKVDECCSKCPLDAAIDNGANTWTDSCLNFIVTHRDEANEIILKWCEEHPVKTRQDKFLEIYPNANVRDGVVRVCPRCIESSRHCQFPKCECLDCKRNYWLAEVDE